MTPAPFIDIINQLLPEPHAGLLSGLLFGTKSALPVALKQALTTTGTLHIIALSGMNIAILASLIDRVLLQFVGRRVSSWCTLFIIWFFVWFVGGGPSIIRAACMGSMAIVAGLLGRQYWAILAWAVTTALMLIMQPQWLADVSFQLSVLATLGILLFGKQSDASPSPFSSADSNHRYRVVFCMVKDIVVSDLRLTLSAQVFTIPLIFLTFHRISLISPLSNILIGWSIAPLTALGWMTIFAAIVWFPVGQVLAWFDWALLEYLVRTIYLMSAIPFAGVEL